MIQLTNHGMYLVDGVPCEQADVAQQEARQGTMAWRILQGHNVSGDPERLQIRFDAMVSHDITYVGIIQQARASGMKEFPIPYALTNCHNSLCAVGGTINEDDHVFGLSAAKKYGGIYVPANQSVIHSYAREQMAKCGAMILGSDSHTRYGALGTMAVGEGGPELAKQLLKNTWDAPMPEVVMVYLTGKPRRGIGPHDVAIALVKATFESGFVNNKVLEFVGPGIRELPIDFRNGVDVMTTETTCLSSIWETDEETQGFYAAHQRPEDYAPLHPAKVAYYDRMIAIDLSKIESMIALPFHPSNAWTIHEFLENAQELLAKVEADAAKRFPKTHPHLTDKIHDGGVWADQGVIAGCAGGLFDNITEAADILKGGSTGNGAFTLDVYPTSVPVSLELTRDGVTADLLTTGAVIKPSFCGPCFGAGDVPANNGLSLRHTTRNFPNREGSKPGEGQFAAVCLMDARSIAATAANGGTHHRRHRCGLCAGAPRLSLRQVRVRQPAVLRLRQGRSRRGAGDGPQHHRLAQNVRPHRESAGGAGRRHPRRRDHHRRADPLRRDLLLPLQPPAFGGVHPQPPGAGVRAPGQGRGGAGGPAPRRRRARPCAGGAG